MSRQCRVNASCSKCHTCGLTTVPCHRGAHRGSKGSFWPSSLADPPSLPDEDPQNTPEVPRPWVQRMRDASTASNTAPSLPAPEKLEVFRCLPALARRAGLCGMLLCLLLLMTGLELSFQNCLVQTLPAGHPARTSSLWSGIRIRCLTDPFQGHCCSSSTQSIFYKSSITQAQP